MNFVGKVCPKCITVTDGDWQPLVLREGREFCAKCGFVDDETKEEE